jgi:hypothetical protein
LDKRNAEDLQFSPKKKIEQSIIYIFLGRFTGLNMIYTEHSLYTYFPCSGILDSHNLWFNPKQVGLWYKDLSKSHSQTNFQCQKNVPAISSAIIYRVSTQHGIDDRTDLEFMTTMMMMMMAMMLIIIILMMV